MKYLILSSFVRNINTTIMVTYIITVITVTITIMSKCYNYNKSVIVYEVTSDISGKV